MKPFFHAGAYLEAPTLVLQAKSGESLGALDGVSDITYKKNLNSANELSFTVSKYLDGTPNPLWNELTDLKNIYVPEFQERFEIKISCQEEDMETKSVTGTSLCEAELGQLLLRGLEINTDQDIEYNSTDDYPVTVFYMDINDHDSPETAAKKRQHSLLHRALSGKASFYKIGHIDDSLKNRSYTFSADGISIYDFLTGEVAEQMECLFLFDSMTREIHAYALSDEETDEESAENPAKTRSSEDREPSFWRDTAILIDRENLASSLTCEGDVDSLKNCFYVEGGDASVNAAFIQINPSGDQYLYYFSPETLDEMPKILQDAISAYNDKAENYLAKNPKKPGETTHRYQKLPEKDASYMAAEDFDPNRTDSRYSTEFQKAIDAVAELQDGSGKKPYSHYSYTIPEAFTSQEELVSAYYHALDFSAFVEHSMMPDYKMEEYDKYHALALLNASNFGTIGIAGLDVKKPSNSSIENAVKNKAKTLINTALYSVAIDTLEISIVEATNTVRWKGTFSITDRSETDNALRTITNSTYRSIAQKEDYTLGALNIPDTVTLSINDDVISYAKNSIAAMLAKKDLPMAPDLYSPETTETEFQEKAKFYGLDTLNIMESVLTDCLGIAGEQLENIEHSSISLEQNDIYKQLTQYRYLYLKKQTHVSARIAERESQLAAAEAFILLMEAYLSEVKQELDFENYLVTYGQAHNQKQNLWEIFQYYRREGEYQNSNLLSTGLKTNAEVLRQAQKLMELASKELKTAGTMQYTISTTMDNLLALPEFACVSHDFDVGNWIRVRMDVQDAAGFAQIYKLRLLSYQVSYGTDAAPEIQVEFSTVTRGSSGVLSEVEDILNSAQTMAKSYGYTQKQAEIASKTTETVDHWVSDGLDLTNQKIQNSANNQSLVIDSSGLLARKQDPLTEIFDPCQLRIFNNGIYITHDNWETADAALGKFWYQDPDNHLEPTETYGVIARKLVGEQVLGEDLRFTNSSGTLRFSEQGLTISNGVNTIRFQPNAQGTDGQPGNIIMITAKKEQGNGNVQEEQLLYTDAAGNLHMIGTIQANAGSFHGTVTATDGSFTGSVNAKEISTDSRKFSVDSDGILKATDAVISGTVHAKKGDIGGFNITDTYLANGTASLGGHESSVYIGTDGISCGDSFRVSKTGEMNASNIQIETETQNGTVTINSNGIQSDRYMCANKSKNEICFYGFCAGAKNYCNLLKISGNSVDGKEYTAYLSSDCDHFFFRKPIYSNELYSQSLSLSGNIRLKSANYNSIGRINCPWKDENIHDAMTIGDDGLSLYLGWAGSNVYTTTTILRGGSVRLGNTSGTLVTSDERLKNSFITMDAYENFFDSLEPYFFKLNSGTSNRYHSGFKAQQVLKALQENHLSSQDFGGFVKYAVDESSPDYHGYPEEYGLIYSEFIALNTHMIQKTRRELQEARQTIERLQQDIADLKAAIKNLQEVH